MGSAAELETERDRVEAWRLKQLLAAGYEYEDAAKLAALVDVDLHEAVELRLSGCDSNLALSILR